MAENQPPAKGTAPPVDKPGDNPTLTTVASLRAENAALRAQLAAAGGRVLQPEHVFQLSEGDRQELEIRGVANIGGRLMTTAEVREALADAGEVGVKIADAPEGTRVDPALLPDITGPGVRGIDFVYPSVERGKIDPAVAGTPGISGPPADTKSS